MIATKLDNKQYGALFYIYEQNKMHKVTALSAKAVAEKIQMPEDLATKMLDGMAGEGLLSRQLVAMEIRYSMTDEGFERMKRG